MNKDKLIINLYHIGGGDTKIGPAECIISEFPNLLRLYLFDVRPDSTDQCVIKFKKDYRIPVNLITVGVDDSSGMKPFYVNKFSLSSSLLKSSKLSKNENPNYSFCKTWGENTKLDKTIKVSTDKLDSIINKNNLNLADFISVDVQGADLRVLKGSKNNLDKSVLGIVAETEFYEIYEKQPLIQNFLDFLNPYGFRLVEIFNIQNWYSQFIVGKGLSTVSETFFIKYLVNKKNNYYSHCHYIGDYESISILKIAMIAFAFKRFSYMHYLLSYIKTNDRSLFNDIQEISDLNKMISVYKIIEKNKKIINYLQINYKSAFIPFRFFENNFIFFLYYGLIRIIDNALFFIKRCKRYLQKIFSKII